MPLPFLWNNSPFFCLHSFKRLMTLISLNFVQKNFVIPFNLASLYTSLFTQISTNLLKATVILGSLKF